ncbi:predicted protein [Pyrenophora tritici-repentis Pt-1C-BFP]|uniref:Uncharacterized protein n=1 Tax=Pyrenophora tritici-repentis (strain Pt-1C-BFP) TaxID=426418 RepID=B2W5E7_PYRTR|nr:uncharacterized protein PTRG_04847 [Pyrenophora tritici-repentis Pt-1C-BFP]EDU47754.1 predicted protein [Pyrenophora tritici-repentis Pt-1C-BFP]
MLLTRGPMDVGKPPAFNEEHASPLIQILAWLFLSFSISAVVAQFATKTAMSKRLIGADYVLLAALRAVRIFIASMNIVTDLALAIVPTLMVLPLQLSPEKRLTLLIGVWSRIIVMFACAGQVYYIYALPPNGDLLNAIWRVVVAGQVIQVAISTALTATALFVAASGAAISVDGSVKLPKIPSIPKIPKVGVNVGKRGSASVYLDASVDLPKLPSLPKINIGKRDPASVYLDASVDLPKLPSLPKINIGKRDPASVYLDASVDLPKLPSLPKINIGKRDPASVYLDASVDLPKLPSLPKINIGKRDPASVYLDASVDLPKLPSLPKINIGKRDPGLTLVDEDGNEIRAKRDPGLTLVDENGNEVRAKRDPEAISLELPNIPSIPKIPNVDINVSKRAVGFSA